MWSSDDLIVANATPPGVGARMIVRLAGEGLDALLVRLFDIVDPRGTPRSGDPPRVVAARLAAAGLGRGWGPLPVVLLHWPGPGGPVGGPLVEAHVPGSLPLVDEVVAEACRHGARLARGGEFTLRSFLAGRIDLVQAEAVLGVIDARTPGELAAALDRMAGGAGSTLRGIRSAILDLVADVEAAIDFADEATPDAVPVADAAAWKGIVERLGRIRAGLAETAAELRDRNAGARGEPPRVVLAGRPNIGKSSLFNALVGRDAALVADEPGTTRDWLEAPLAGDGGHSCMIVDLAGIDDGPESCAAAVARGVLERADVVVACRDAGDHDAPPAVAERPLIDVVTRCDRVPTPAAAVAIHTSAVDGRGIEALRTAIRNTVAALPSPGATATVRMVVGIEAAAAATADAAAECDRAARGDEAVVAGHLRRALTALDEVTGAAIGTDLLDRIFSRHCVGK